MKKIISAVTAMCIAAAMTTPVLAANSEFSDISGSQYSWASDAIESMAEKGYISGYEDGTFRPDNEVTRLEVLALFAREMGSNNEINEPIVEIALEKYSETIAGYSLSWGTEEIAYLMYKGILTENDLTTYLLGDLKDEAMPRYEAAIIITKAMGGESDAKAISSSDYVISYSDQSSIKSSVLPYVNYVSLMGIMNGMGDNEFSPNTSVLRSQMAVMLQRCDEASGYTFKSIKAISIKGNTSDGYTLTYTTDDPDDDDVAADSSSSDDTEYIITLSDDAALNVAGDHYNADVFPEKVAAVLTLSNGEAVALDALTETSDEVLTGVYVGNISSGGVLKTITIRYQPEGSGSNIDKAISVSEDCDIIYDNSPSNISVFKKGSDQITVYTEDGKAVKIVGEQESTTISNATIEEISIDPDFTVTISHSNSDYDGKTYEVSESVTVFKNNESCTMSEIYRGDSVTLTLQYGIVTKISATSKTKIITGAVIQSLTIATQSSMTVKVNDTVYEYDIPIDCEIVKDDDTATLYDFRVGDIVNLTLNSNAITKITAVSSEVSTSGILSGVITAVNSGYGFIKIAVSGSDDTTASEETLFCSTGTTILTTSGTTKTLSQLKVGQTVASATGSISNGAFAATVIIIKE